MFTYENQRVIILSGCKKNEEHLLGYDVMLPNGDVQFVHRSEILATGEKCRCGEELPRRHLDLPMWSSCDHCFGAAVDVMTQSTPKQVIAWKTAGKFGNQADAAWLEERFIANLSERDMLRLKYGGE